MSLSAKQRVFTRNIGRLIEFAFSVGIELTMGEAFRTKSQMLLNFYGYVVKEVRDTITLVKSRKLSNTKNSKHGSRLAQDFNFFIDGQLTYDKEKLQILGDYWESLHPDNRWGGNFKSFLDTPHFEMR